MIAPSLHVLIGMIIGILNITWKYLEIAWKAFFIVCLSPH
jgi:intracellular septation protein A